MKSLIIKYWDVEAVNEALLQNLYIILSIVISVAGIVYAIMRLYVDRQIRDLRFLSYASFSSIYALHSAFLELHDKIRRGESLNVNNVVSSVVASLGKAAMGVIYEVGRRALHEDIIERYLQLPLKEGESLDTDGEARKRELLVKFKERRITYEEALELQALLEEQKRRHEEAGKH